MGYRVRNEHGELRFGSFDELREAYVHSMVGPEDEIQEDGSTSWRRANQLPQLVRSAEQSPPVLQTTAKWYLLAGGVFAVGALLLWALLKGPGKGIVGFIAVYGVALLIVGVFGYLAMSKMRRRQ